MRGIDEYYLYVRDNHIRLLLYILCGLDEAESVDVPFDYVVDAPFIYADMNPYKEVNNRRYRKLEKFISAMIDCGIIFYNEDTDTFSFRTGKDYADYLNAATLWLKSLK